VTRRLLKTEDVSYIAGEWTGKNTSELWPFGEDVVILPDRVAEKVGSGFLYAAQETMDLMNANAASGIIMAMGPDAFSHNSFGDGPFVGVKPQPGDHVVFTRHSGQSHTGKDGRVYFIMNARALGAWTYLNQSKEQSNAAPERTGS
jgi:co-chaperonin GroES (HSP10)